MVPFQILSFFQNNQEKNVKRLPVPFAAAFLQAQYPRESWLKQG